MFRKLRNKLILINLGITTVVVLVVFSAIFWFATRSAEQREPMAPPSEIIIQSESDSFYDDFMQRIVALTIREEKQAAANNLLIILICSAISIEIAVALVSYYLAEEAIKPVREAYEAQKIFIANASHEIKTPLAAISANLEAADIHDNKWIENVEIETAKLTKLNSELLNLAKTGLADKREATEVDVGEAVREVLKSFNPRMKNLKISKKISTQKKIKINREDFVQIFSILCDNAVKYANSKIQLCVDEHKLEISNDGTKIDKKNLPHIFERFYQVDKSADGVGLGLSIAKTLADNNGWSLTAKSDKMTTFTLSY